MEALEKYIEYHVVLPEKVSITVLKKVRDRKNYHSSKKFGEPNKNLDWVSRWLCRLILREHYTGKYFVTSW